jgi:hypothetical protein
MTPPDPPVVQHTTMEKLQRGPCALCLRTAYVTPVTFRTTIGMVLLRHFHKTTGSLCEACVRKVFFQNVWKNSLFGWWSPVSFFITIYSLATNALQYFRARRALRDSPRSLSVQAIVTQPLAPYVWVVAILEAFPPLWFVAVLLSGLGRSIAQGTPVIPLFSLLFFGLPMIALALSATATFALARDLSKPPS